MIARACWSLTLPLLFGAIPENLLASSFVSKSGGFEAAFPVKPAETKQRVRTGTGHLEVHVFQAEDKHDVSYVVSYSDLPESDYKKGTEETRLDYARDGAVMSAMGTLRTEKKHALPGGQRGRDLVIDGKDGLVVRVRLYVVQRRLYQVIVLGPAAAVTGPATASFLDSFRLVK